MPSESCGLKLRLEVDTNNRSTLDGQSRICNWLYNHLLDQADQLKGEFKQGNKEAAKTVYTERGLRNLIPKIKKEHPFLTVVHSSPLKNVALRLSSSIRTHQKSKKKTGWPHFRAWKKKWFSLFYDEPNKGFSIEGDDLILSFGMGQDRKHRSITLKMPDAHLLKGKTIRNLRIVSELGEYYAIFTIQKDLPAQKPISKIIAIDPNHKNFGYGVDIEGNAIEIAAPYWLKNYDKRIDELKAQRDRCEKKAKKLPVLDTAGNPTDKFYYIPSKQWKKYNKKLCEAYRKRREQTKTFMFTAAHCLISKYDCVGIGDYAPQGEGITTKMRRAMNNRSMIGRFKEVLSWVAKKSGKTSIIFDEEGTTRTCRHCNLRVEGGIAPSIRKWQCKQCEAIHIRDENSAINGLNKILWALIKNSGLDIPQVSCSDLAVKQRWAWRVSTSGVIVTSQGRNSENNVLAATRN